MPIHATVIDNKSRQFRAVLACARSVSSASGNKKTVNLNQVNGLSSKFIKQASGWTSRQLIQKTPLPCLSMTCFAGCAWHHLPLSADQVHAAILFVGRST